ncbi:hypothetical protein F2Q70_00017470 [Brassica cretica]|uniref:Uncharacterized protein n=1 Tax=Brassica cretica TaxID=69181 RepID=A0A8S9KXP9_BRACR|nr:hypothetical protein F2Q70_00017470 [Brassica cretica]KAF2598103.1 hypothetical protein F2Q68_00010425 [Brassica cretica]
MEGSPYRKLFFSWGKGAVPGTGPGVLYSGEPGYLLAGIQRPVSCLGSGGSQYLRMLGSFIQYQAIYYTVSEQIKPKI